MGVRFVNNFRAPLASAVASDATTLNFPAGYGDAFRTALGSALGTDHVYGTLFNSGGDIEIVKITATTDDAFTVLRGQDGTTAKAWLAGEYMACRPCAASLSEVVSLPTDLARSGINIDITELRGLTTPLSVAQGGTGVTSLSALLSALGITLPLPVASGGTGVTSLSALKTAMGLTVGTNVMAYVAPGAAGNTLVSNGTTWESSTPTSLLTRMTAQAATGTTVDFTSIPSWVKRVTVALKNITAVNLYLQIGDAGGVETSGYTLGYGGGATAFTLSDSSVSMASGVVTLINESGNTWCVSGSFAGVVSDGYKALSDTLTRVRILSTGFAGSGEINVLYE